MLSKPEDSAARPTQGVATTSLGPLKTGLPLKRPLPGPMGHLGDKADLTPSPLRVSGSHGGGLTGETNDVVRCYGFALTEQASVTLLMPRRNHCSPLMAPQPQGVGNGAERNRTAVRNTGVDHLVRSRSDLFILPPAAANRRRPRGWASPYPGSHPVRQASRSGEAPASSMGR